MAKDRFYGLVIMDGFGEGKPSNSNAVYVSGTPFIKRLKAKYPNTLIGASGMDVGLPEGQMGNSEVGHLNIGAGRIVYQELTRITKAIRDGDFFTNPELLAACRNAKENNRALHLMGLVSEGGVHSHIEHLYALLALAASQGLEEVYIHVFLDGRDVSPTSGLGDIKNLESKINEIGVGRIASVTGRFYAMDRDNIWDRVSKAYAMLTVGAGLHYESAAQAIADSYARGVTDEFVLPSVICDNDTPIGLIDKGDSVIFFNFRPDRARQLTRSFIYSDFDRFERPTGWLNPTFVSFTQYDETFTNLGVAFKPSTLDNTFGEYISRLGYKQFRIAETQKYAHVTFFFNGGVEKPNPQEDRILIPSPKIATFDLKPEMSAIEVTDKAVEVIASREYDVMILNFANCDMVGHTGVMEAAVKAVATVDACVERIVKATQDIGGAVIVTADHGNADEMKDSDGSPLTAHSLNPVPFILVDDTKKGATLRDGGVLADVIPTLLEIMGEEKPAEMTGVSLLAK